MKIEIGKEHPSHFPVYWEGQYDVFSHFDYLSGIPSPLFAVTTLKENGLPNLGFQAWSSFIGKGDGFYAIMGGVFKGSHTYQNILRTGEFVANFLGKDYLDGCLATIKSNGEDTDEIAAGGMTREKAVTVQCPRIAEAFLCLECEFEKEVSLDACTDVAVIIGRVRHIALEEAFSKGMDEKYGKDGFMFNINEPKDARTGEGRPSAAATMDIFRVYQDS